MRESSYDEYQASWGDVLQTCRDLVASGNTSLARVMAALTRPGSDADGNARLLKRYGFRICGERVNAPAHHAYESVFFEATVQHELVTAIDPDTVNIIELGSGYSRNLFHIWLNNGPLDANYFGMEYTQSGRDCGSFLAALEPRMRYQSHAFDYYNLALPPFDVQAKTLVFTCYSIEQITQLPSNVFDLLLGIPGLHKVVHLEPVGWQMGPKLSPFPSDLALWLRTVRSTRSTRYNTNLISTLKQLERDDKISIDRPMKIDFFAHRPDLPGSLISWRPRR